jgi:hypothetical protein
VSDIGREYAGRPGPENPAEVILISSSRHVPPFTRCVEVDLVDEATLSVRGPDEWELVIKGARAVERVQPWGTTGTIFRIELEGGQTKHYIVFESVDEMLAKLTSPQDTASGHPGPRQTRARESSSC